MLSIRQAKSDDEKKEAERKAKVLEDKITKQERLLENQVKEQKRLSAQQNRRIEAAEEAKKTAEEAKTAAEKAKAHA